MFFLGIISDYNSAKIDFFNDCLNGYAIFYRIKNPPHKPKGSWGGGG
jgi:hypothetical protein